MSERTVQVYLRDILFCIEAIETYLTAVSENDYETNQMLQDAVVRRFEIIGEASNQMTKEFKNKFPEIEWRLMTDMRNKLAHEYFGMENSTVYNTAKINLPELKVKLQKIL